VRARATAVQTPRHPRRATLAMVNDAPSLTVVRAVADPVDAIERAILREAQNMLRRLTRQLDTRVAILVNNRLAPIDRNEARRFMADFRRGELI
jgi:hypothetical protein